MKVLIVAKTRRGGGACVGGITADGRSVRLVAADADTNDHAGLEYSVGEVWDFTLAPDPNIIPPHVENVVARSARRLKAGADVPAAVRRFMAAVRGGPDLLFDGRLQALPSGALYIAERTGLPARSTMFWMPDQPLRLDYEGKRIRYRYPTPDGGRSLTFVGFQEPVESIPAGTLLRVSLAHWWRPKEKPDEELRCHAQLSGWFLAPGQRVVVAAPPPSALTTTVTSIPLERARRVLKETFGFAEFQSRQAEVIRQVLQRRDTLAVMPTGGGKSLCYQLPALLFDGVTAVVSPLIALMQDQVHQLRELAVPAAFLNSTLPHAEYLRVVNRIREGGIRIIYAAPETLLRPETLLLLEHSRLACLAVDEAHCISEWGHDFRPEYRKLQEARRRFPQAVCLALTATATPRVRADIRQLLGIEASSEFVASFNRPNLFLSAQPRRDGLGQTLAFLHAHRDQSGIIYCGTRQQVDELAGELSARHFPALAYHAGLDDAVRRLNQEQFIQDDAAIMVATVAFGMGINKSNVRFILHYHLPKDLESYYQEVGRAGRDGLRADCLLLHSRADAFTIQHFIEEGAASERAGRQARLEAMLRYAEAPACRRGPLLAYFGETFADPCGHCDHCQLRRAAPAPTDVTMAARMFLSCAVRTGEVFGPAHLIAVLRGSRTRKILEHSHDRLPIHGIGQEHSTNEWRELARQFIAQGLVEQDLQFGGLRLTPKGRGVLQGEKVFATVVEPVVVSGTPADTGSAHDQELFQHLRELRRELARQAKVPPYVIFSDRALIEMAAHCPQDAAQFLTINGVGQVKLANYGEAFLQVIRDHCAARRGVPAGPREEDPPEPTPWLTVKRRFQRVGEQFASGRSIEELQAQYGMKPGTILAHLYEYCQTGGRLEADRLRALSKLGVPDRVRVEAAFAEHGWDRLGPVHAALGGQISYEELHLVRLYLRCRERPR